MHGNNGIAQASNGTFYVVNAPGGQLSVLEKQADNTLVITDVIQSGKEETFHRVLSRVGLTI